jgi:hypothetical protein
VHIIAIAWIYVTLLMALTERSVTAGVLTFLLYGVAPLALFVYVFGTPWRKRRRRAAAQARGASVAVPGHPADEPDRADAKSDQ